MENKQHIIIKVWTNICRFLLAGVFVFSGFVKSIDPQGTLYKLQDYLTAFGMPYLFPESLLYGCSVLLGCVEFCLGIYLFFGIRRRITPRLMLAVMSFMTPLTLWLAIDNPISDCGCFGDAFILSNWETFWKNIFLLIAAISIFKWRKCISPLVTTRFDWLIALYSWIYIFAIITYCMWHLPVFDFRPYYIGADIRAGMEIPEGKEPTLYETRFIMQKDGVEKEFSLEEYPDSTWTIVDTRVVVKKRGYEPPIHDFMIERFEDGADITDEILNDTSYTFLLVSHQLDKADDSSIDLINELYDYSLKHGYVFYALTSSSDEEITWWMERTGAEYPFAIMDDTTLKTIIRSNPGVVLLKDGVVINKWNTNDLPDEYQLTDKMENLSIGQLRELSSGYQIMLVFAWFILPLAIVCMIDRLWERYVRKKFIDLNK